MKRLLAAVLTLALALTGLSTAMAVTYLDPTENRNITLASVGDNSDVLADDIASGISPTTGLTLSDLGAPAGFAGLAVTGRYMPMMVQIDNSDGGVDETAPWGASYADIVYETPLHKLGMTRISYIFSDLIPNSVGPVRSARVGHAWIREEWGAGFLYYGTQKYAKSNVEDVFKDTGADSKGVLFSGTVGEGKEWKQFYTRRSDRYAPHNVDANVAAMYELIPADYEPVQRAFLFTDEMPEGDSATEIVISWDTVGYGSNLIYDEDNDAYFRYMRQKDNVLVPYEDSANHQQMAFNNVIIQWCETTWNRSDAPLTWVAGKNAYGNAAGASGNEGNADIFQCGVHIAGYWKRDGMYSRTVFYDADGNELKLQRGKTLITVIDPSHTIAYQ